jgi:hypothetical protein
MEKSPAGSICMITGSVDQRAALATVDTDALA